MQDFHPIYGGVLVLINKTMETMRNKCGLLVLLAPVVWASYVLFKDWQKLNEPMDLDIE